MAAGPEEMKWPEKGLYTLGIRFLYARWIQAGCVYTLHWL